MQAFCLRGDRYQTVQLTDGRLLIPSVELSLGVWQGDYANLERLWLRWMTLEGELISIAEEQVIEAQQQVAQAQQQALEAQQRAIAAEQEVEQLRRQLQQLGINPDEIL